MSNLQTTLFILGSLALGYLSRKSLSQPSSHGFYRFFAWEAILGLILLNLPVWFNDLLSCRQLISWFLLSLSLILAIHGFWLLKQVGQPDGQRAGETELPLEKTTQLITIGAYRYIRHPLYGSLLLLAWGIFFKSPAWIGAGLSLLATLFLYATAKTEERENLRYFGTAYQEYMKKTRMFLPFIF